MRTHIPVILLRTPAISSCLDSSSAYPRLLFPQNVLLLLWNRMCLSSTVLSPVWTPDHHCKYLEGRAEFTSAWLSTLGPLAVFGRLLRKYPFLSSSLRALNCANVNGAVPLPPVPLSSTALASLFKAFSFGLIVFP